MTAVDATSGWTALIPGFVLAGAGIGLVNPPLASTAIGVVPARAQRHGLGDQHHLPPGRASPRASPDSARSSSTASRTARAPR